MTNRTLIAYGLIVLIIASPFIFLWVRGLVHKRARRISEEPIYIKR